MSSKNKINKEEAEKIVKKCYTVSDFCKMVGWQPRGANYKTFYKYVKEYNLDISHFTGNKTNFNNKNNGNNELTVSEYIKNNEIVRGPTLVKKLIKEGIKECKCERCKNTEWEGQKIPLELHHIDGNSLNNELSNLQLLCPNCHAITDNFRGKKNKKEKPLLYCKDCGKQISEYSKSGLCQSCVKKQLKKIDTPSKKELIESFKKFKSFSGVAKQYNCSDNTIRKWANKYKLPIHTLEMKKYLTALNNEPDNLC